MHNCVHCAGIFGEAGIAKEEGEISGSESGINSGISSVSCIISSVKGPPKSEKSGESQSCPPVGGALALGTSETSGGTTVSEAGTQERPGGSAVVKTVVILGKEGQALK